RPTPGKSIPTKSIAEFDQGELTTRTVLTATTESELPSDLVAGVDLSGRSNGGITLRYQNPDNHLTGMYSADRHSIYLIERQAGANSEPLGLTGVDSL